MKTLVCMHDCPCMRVCCYDGSSIDGELYVGDQDQYCDNPDHQEFADQGKY